MKPYKPYKPSFHAYDKAGQFVASYPTAQAAADAHGLSAKAIDAAARRKGVTGGLRWIRSVTAYTTAEPHPDVCVYDDLGALLGAYDTVTGAAAALHVSAQSVVHALHREGRVAGLRVRWSTQGAPGPEARGVLAYRPDGTLAGEYPSAADAARTLSLYAGSLRAVLGSGQELGGLRWERAQPQAGQLPAAPTTPPATREVLAFDEAGQLVGRYPSQRAAALALGVHPGGVSSALRLGYRCAGLRWQYADDPPASAP